MPNDQFLDHLYKEHFELSREFARHELIHDFPSDVASSRHDGIRGQMLKELDRARQRINAYLKTNYTKN